jgi:hypothetical protein
MLNGNIISWMQQEKGQNVTEQFGPSLAALYVK